MCRRLGCRLAVYEEGLNYVYAGNLPGRVEGFENTYCPDCGEVLIERFGYVVLDYRLMDEGACPSCDRSIPGIWPQSADQVRTGTRQDLFVRTPRSV